MRYRLIGLLVTTLVATLPVSGRSRDGKEETRKSELTLPAANRTLNLDALPALAPPGSISVVVTITDAEDKPRTTTIPLSPNTAFAEVLIKSDDKRCEVKFPPNGGADNVPPPDDVPRADDLPNGAPSPMNVGDLILTFAPAALGAGVFGATQLLDGDAGQFQGLNTAKTDGLVASTQPDVYAIRNGVAEEANTIKLLEGEKPSDDVYLSDAKGADAVITKNGATGVNYKMAVETQSISNVGETVKANVVTDVPKGYELRVLTTATGGLKGAPERFTTTGHDVHPYQAVAGQAGAGSITATAEGVKPASDSPPTYAPEVLQPRVEGDQLKFADGITNVRATSDGVLAATENNRVAIDPKGTSTLDIVGYTAAGLGLAGTFLQLGPKIWACPPPPGGDKKKGDDKKKDPVVENQTTTVTVVNNTETRVVVVNVNGGVQGPVVINNGDNNNTDAQNNASNTEVKPESGSGDVVVGGNVVSGGETAGGNATGGTGTGATGTGGTGTGGTGTAGGGGTGTSGAGTGVGTGTGVGVGPASGGTGSGSGAGTTGSGSGGQSGPATGGSGTGGTGTGGSGTGGAATGGDVTGGNTAGDGGDGNRIGGNNVTKEKADGKKKDDKKKDKKDKKDKKKAEKKGNK